MSRGGDTGAGAVGAAAAAAAPAGGRSWAGAGADADPSKKIHSVHAVIRPATPRRGIATRRPGVPIDFTPLPLLLDPPHQDGLSSKLNGSGDSGQIP